MIAFELQILVRIFHNAFLVLLPEKCSIVIFGVSDSNWSFTPENVGFIQSKK